MRLAAVLGGACSIGVLAAAPAVACTLAMAPIEVSDLTVRPGERIHISGSGFYDVVPEAERQSTTTTTAPGGAVVPLCPETRPVTSVTVSFAQAGRSSVELATVAGSSVDLDVVIPATAVPGTAMIVAPGGSSGELTILAGTTVTTTPQLPRTGTNSLLPLGLVAIGLLVAGLVASWHGPARSRLR